MATMGDAPMLKRPHAVALLILLAGTTAALAQTTPSTGNKPAPSMRQTMPSMNAPATAGDSSAAFRAANEKMMKEMSTPPTGDTDKDFVGGMIPHHQGAIDMATIELKYGKDQQLKKLARDIIAAQKKE